MRSIPGLALGTYYAVGASGGATTPNAVQMRGLLYAVKDNRQPPNAPQLIGDPRHPATPPGPKVDRNNAVDYVAAIVGQNLATVQNLLGLAGDPLLIPIPSSEVVASTVATARWPARKLALALEAVGFGRCRAVVVNNVPVAGKTAGGGQRTCAAILQNLHALAPLPADQPVILVDDTVTSGASVAAMDTLLGRLLTIRVFAVGLTDVAAANDAFLSRRFSVEYDPGVQLTVPTVVRY